ncbi:MAG: DUF711 family protein [Anaerolineaceae bacterium]|nr:DUF711 family protein [Anaerolineaceae bacterium]
MEIRSITYFCNPSFPVNTLLLQKAGTFMRHARTVFEEAGFSVQTARLATPPFPLYLNAETFTEGAQSLEFQAHGEGFDYVSIGPATADRPDSYAAIVDILKSTSNLFVSGFTTTPNGELSMSAVHACAEVIKQAATLEKDGFANLRFAALANVSPWAPFFPAAFHIGSSPAFALALEAADLAVDAFSSAASLENARSQLIKAVESQATSLEEIGRKLESIYQVEFKGLDFTLAPYPTEARSIGTALERLGVPAVGLHGSLAAATFITDTMDRANFKRCGFIGLMLPVLEDSILALRAGEGSLGINDLLLYSTVCGTGLDVIPLAGDTTTDHLYAVLLDLSSLALRLNKPLTARLMPIPGKKEGDPTDFEFEYFANSRVMPIKAEPLTGLLVGSDIYPIAPKKKI